MTGSISTVPLGFKGVVSREDLPLVSENLMLCSDHLAQIRAANGGRRSAGPGTGTGLPAGNDGRVCVLCWLRLPPELADLLGICYDCCHQAVEFEEPGRHPGAASRAGIPIAKVQVSSALRSPAPMPRSC